MAKMQAEEGVAGSTLEAFLAGTNERGNPRRIVKIAPGRQAMHWDDCLQGGYVCVGWSEVGDLRNYENREALREAFEKAGRYPSSKSTLSRKVSELWLMRELVPGDVVVANRGTKEILAIGKVVSGYKWRPERTKYKHTVDVNWDLSFAGSIPAQRYWANVTLLELEAEALEEMIEGGEPLNSSNEHLASIGSSVAEAGLVYSEEVVSAYLLSLRSKRFVILSGISGTGKTQLALAVARALGAGETVDEAEVEAEDEVEGLPDGAVSVVVRPYMRKYRRFVIPQALVTMMRLPESIRERGGEIEVEWPKGKGNLWIGRTSTSAMMLGFRKEFSAWFREELEVGDTFFIELLEGENDQLRIRIGLHETKSVRPKEARRYTVIAVRPDWTDNRSLLGYYNPILQQYVATEFLRLLLRAMEEESSASLEGREPEPYFVILDEMNLARVEHYFSDLLSAFESGEPIELHADDEVESGEKGELPVPKSIRIPGNLFFTGTVNVDETTFMFSPKVLDRAFVMELNQVDLEGIGVSAPEEGGLRILDLPTPFTGTGRAGLEDWEALGHLEGGSLRAELIKLHVFLKEHGRHFGYRVAFEIARFIVLAHEQGDGSPQALWRALDLAILFKVLPKFHGTQQELEDLLRSLFEFATGSDSEYEDWKLEGGRVFREGEQARLPSTAAKVYRMADTLRRRGFASFIE